MTDKILTLNILIFFLFVHRNYFPVACLNRLYIFDFTILMLLVSIRVSHPAHYPSSRFRCIAVTFWMLAVSFFRSKCSPNIDVNKEDKSELMNK